jgi:hypothetical protein
LIGKWVEFYDEMKSKHGEPELADTNIRMGPMRWGSESPITIDELRKRSFPDAVQWVVSWTPNPRLAMGPEREGLANAFGQYIAGSAVDFSNQAAVMRHCPPIYVRTFLSKMEEAVKAGQLIDLEPVLGLCEWVVGQPSSKTVDSVRDDVWLEDRSWEWTRGEISRFIEAVCKAVSGGNPVYSVEQYREPLWKLLGQLVRDGADSAIVSDRNEEDPRTHDYVTHAINSPRGKAMEAAFEYARWVGNYVARQAGDKSAVPDGLDALPEFRSMFEWQIDASNAAVEAFAIIGMHVGLLYWIDKVWLANKVGTIFSIEPYKSGRNKECGWAAWNAFLVWVAPHVEYYKLLQSQYAYAVEQSAGLEVTERAMEQPAFRLGEHLMILYGRGHLPLDDDATLVRTFIERANPKVRRRAFSFIGWSFRREEEIPQPILNRFMAIWDFYWTKVGQVDAQASDDDLFGRWFSSGQFPDVWSLDRLEQYVRVANTFEADDELVKRLADIAAADISKSLSILEALVHGDEQGWRIHSWWESAASILKAALAASVDIRDKAQALIDYLGRRGFLQFGELLKTP